MLESRSKILLSSLISSFTHSLIFSASVFLFSTMLSINCLSDRAGITEFATISSIASSLESNVPCVQLSSSVSFQDQISSLIFSKFSPLIFSALNIPNPIGFRSFNHTMYFSQHIIKSCVFTYKITSFKIC